MPCNAVLQQTGVLTLNPTLVLQQPTLLLTIARQLALTHDTPCAVCTPSRWGPTYSAHLAQQPLDTFDFPSQGVLFFCRDFSVALYPDGRLELRDGTQINYQPPNAQALLDQLSSLLTLAAGLALQQLVAAQLSTLGTITQSQTAANGSLVLSLNV